MSIALSVLLLVSVLANAWLCRVISDDKREILRLNNKLEDGEAVGRLPHEDTPISLLRIRQDR